MALAVKPWIAVAKGVAMPADTVEVVKSAFEAGARWWENQMQRTFDVAQPTVYHTPLTYAELRKRHGEPNQVWFALQRAAGEAGAIDNCDPTQAHYMIALGGEMGGGMVGSENFGCEHILPGKAAITGGFAFTLLGRDPKEYGLPEQPWFANERRNAIGACMHELGHMFGDGVSHPLDHTSDDRNLMHGWWNWPDVSLNADQIKQLSGSPFLR